MPKIKNFIFVVFMKEIQFQLLFKHIINMELDKGELFPLKLDPRAYRFFPRRQEQKSAFEKKGTRFFFYGQIEHDQYELRKLREFHEYVAKKEKKYNKELFNNQQLILQFLSANKYKPKETLKAMAEHSQFKINYLPTIRLEKIENILKLGFYYPCGRDRFFRPILIFKLSLFDQKNVDAFFDALVYTQQVVIQKFFLPGQVESWSIIYDLSGIGLSQIPLTALKGLLGKISLNYGGRLHKLWILNAPSGVSTSWKIVSTFLDDVTVEKIKISKLSTEKSIFDNIDPSQIQVKYGGTQPNRTQFYPFLVPQGIFDQKRLISNEDYEKLLSGGKLKNNVIDPLYKGTK